MVTLLLAVFKIVCLLIMIAYFTLAERKLMAGVQRRVGPNVVGPNGLGQPLADGLKLAGKTQVIPMLASSGIFKWAAVLVLAFSLTGWGAVPFGLFDLSECMNTKTVVKILTLSDSSV
jgi:NADH-quinone oxidoreductase subunit H